MKQRKKKLTFLLLIPLVLVVLLQGLLPFSILLTSRTKETMVRNAADMALARGSGIALDSSWNSVFHFLGSGVRSADDFFYTPYLLARQNTDADMVDLGYWATPFILEDHRMDNHQMITYSIPLCYQGTVYGILGTEISTSYLSTGFLPVRDLDCNQNAGYAIATDLGNGTYRIVSGKGLLFDSIRRDHEVFSLEETEYRDLFRVKDSAIGTQGIYSAVSRLNLYSGKVPYMSNKPGVIASNSLLPLPFSGKFPFVFL